MGGGSRTIPGSINKWKWKRLQNRRARERGTRLLDHERQKFESQIRSNIRLKLSGKSEARHSSLGSSLSLKQQVKLLADRFVTDRADDLWNENDGFMRFPDRKLESARCTDSPHNLWRAPLEIRKLTGAGPSSSEIGKKSQKLTSPNSSRSYSMFTAMDLQNDVGSSASLLKHDVKFNKRIRLKKSEYEILRDEVDDDNVIKQEDCEIREGEKEASLFTEKRFDELKISPIIIQALTASGYVQQTNVQACSLPICLAGEDALVKAKNGSGKSVAFLIPAIETVLNSENDTSQQQLLHPIYVVVLCPTRELASQIAAEANALLRFHSAIRVQTLVGGTRFKDDLKALREHHCQVIIATPGRLIDHIGNKSGLSVNLMGLKLLVLDEADRLLDLGCRKDIENIVDCLPRQRQTLLFTSTVPKEVRRISQLLLKRNHSFIDTIGLGSVETLEQVKQSYMVLPLEWHFKAVYHFLKSHILKTPDYKVIVFCSTGKVASFMHALFRHMKMNVREIHHRKSHICRARVSEEFKGAKRIVLLSSDVSTRGMDYPDITLVIQVGMPYDREHYIHRLGRTGRAGKYGEGILLLASWEEYFLENLKDLPLQKLTPLVIPEDIHSKVERAITMVEQSTKEGAYHAWLGYYNSIREVGRDKTALVQHSLQFCHSLGLLTPPPLFSRTALKMGLKHIPAIKLRSI